MLSYPSAIELAINKKKNKKKELPHIGNFKIPLLNNWKVEKEIIMEMLKILGKLFIKSLGNMAKVVFRK